MDRLLLAITLALVVIGAPGTPAVKPSPPTQPAFGPGSSAYAYEEVIAERVGAEPTGYWLFTPTGSTGAHRLPVIIFLHGFSAVDPDTYRAWIDHIVRRGAVVIYPDYQTKDLTATPVADYQPNAIAGIQAALKRLAGNGASSVDLSRIAIVGHSLGGVLAFNVAALAPSSGLPPVAAIMSVEPGGCAECGGISTLLNVPFEDLSTIHPDARVVVMVGDRDTVAGDRGAKVAWSMITSVPLEHRDYVVLHSDSWGSPPLIADHYVPIASAADPPNALDWFGTWKFLDLLTDCALFNVQCGEAFGGSAAQLDMGKWSDGHPVTPPTITDTP
jgi:dienelactone hydrolase